METGKGVLKRRIKRLEELLESVKSSKAKSSNPELLYKLTDTLYLYRDAPSMILVQEILRELCNSRSNNEKLVEILLKISKTFKDCNRVSMSKCAFIGLKWCALCNVSGTLINAQSNFLCCLYLSSNSKLINKYIKLLTKDKDKLLSILHILLEATPTFYYLPLLNIICKFCIENGKTKEQLSAKKDEVIGFYSKSIFNCRVVIPEQLVICCTHVLNEISHSKFSESIFSASYKCLLRNPDELIRAVSCLFVNVDLDFSRYAMEYIKNMSSQLYSANASTRTAAVVFIKRLINNCSDAGSCIELTNYLLNILYGKGPSGKLSNTDHRQNVLESIKVFRECPLAAQGMDSLSNVIVESLLLYLKQEAHSGTQLHIVRTISLFCSSFKNVPNNLISHLKSALSSKATPPLMRLCYWQCVDELCKGENKLINDFLNVIQQGIGRVKTAGVQNPVLEEGVTLSWLLMSRAADNDSLSLCLSKLSPLLDSDCFVNSKFLSAADQQTVINIINISRFILVTPLPGLVISSINDWVYSLVHISLTGSSWSVQSQAMNNLKDSVLISEDIVFTIIELLESTIDQEDMKTDRIVNLILKLLLTVAVVTTDDNKIKFIEKSFLIAHHSSLVSLCRYGPWLLLYKRLNIPSMSSLLQPLSSQLHENVNSPSFSTKNGLQSLIAIYGNEVILAIVNVIVKGLGKEEIMRVSLSDMEISETSEDELYNKELTKLLHENLIGQSSMSNVQRSNKAYSHEDHVWDLKTSSELKLRALRDKSIKELIAVSSLTQSQRERIENELDLESKIRKSVNALKTELDLIWSLFRSLLQLGGVALPYFHLLLTPILNGIKSMLAQKICVDMLKNICLVIFNDDRTALLFLWTTLRLEAPKLSPPRTWGAPPITSNINTLIGLLPKDRMGVVNDTIWCYSFPLFKCILETQVELVSESVSVSLLCLSNTCKQAHSDIFPVADFLRLMGVVIASRATPLRSIKSKKLAIDGFKSLINIINEGGDGGGVSNDVINVLVDGLQSNEDLLRQTSLHGLELLYNKIISSDNISGNLQASLLVCCHDVIPDNNQLATKLWQRFGFSKGSKDILSPLFSLVTDPPPSYHKLLPATAQALGQWLEENKNEIDFLYNKLVIIYKSKIKPPVPTADKFGRTLSIDYKDPWEGRVGVAKCLAEFPAHQSRDQCMTMLLFIIPLGLSDANEEVRENMKETALSAISVHGEGLSADLMNHFETCLSRLDDSKSSDITRQSIVVLMGSLAKHMDKGDPKVRTVVQLLLTNLDTPSQTVQVSIAECLVPLFVVMKDEAQETIDSLLNKLFTSPVYSQRRGAAYGLAGIVKGLGIPSLKKYNVTPRLQSALTNKKDYKEREGGLFAFEAFCDMLGKLYEPYVVHLLPDLLLAFGDGNKYVREAAQLAARTIMSNLSGHGMTLILPALLNALQQDSWRTKAGSVELLGTMAYCAPKQLSACLPSIVPKIMEVLADSHSKVQLAGTEALKQIGSVIKSPEIKPLIPLLLEALTNPSVKTQPCLQSLLLTEFEHKVDPPSLALIVPTIRRGLELRSAESKKAAAKLIALLYGVTDSKDLSPYVKELVPGIKQSLTDPLPEVRSTSAEALGSMASGVGSDALKDLWAWLFKTLQSDDTPVDRSGAAQGIAHLLKSQGVEQLHQFMPRFIQSAQDPHSSTNSRDGFLMLFIYLPQLFGKDFLPFIDKILPPILKGLADESEYVRDTSLLSGQTIINNYAEQSVDLFLPQLEKGLLDDNWRIRCSSVQLLGDLLFCISGQSGKMSTESSEDDNFASEEATQSIVSALGEDKRNKVLAGLYMGRSDVALLVRQHSLHVWKLIVTNTAKTLREILPTLINILLSCLASPVYDKRQVAGQTLGDLVRKLGERILPELFPMLERGLKSNIAQEREGVCFGLSQIILETSREYMNMYSSSLIPMVRSALCDKESDVRGAAAKTFESLHSAVGNSILEPILGPLLDQLGKAEEGKREIILDALQQVMAVKSNVVLPMIIPKLTHQPVNMKALSLLSSVAGHSIYKYLNKVIQAIVTALQKKDQVDDNLPYAVDVVLSITEEPGVSLLIDELLIGRKSSHGKRVASLMLLRSFCSETKADLKDHTPQLLIYSIEALADNNDAVCEWAWLTLEAIVTKVIPVKQLPSYISNVQKGLKTCQSIIKDNEVDELNGFKLKGIGPILTILKEGLVSGNHDNKEESAHCLILVIRMSSTATLTSGRVVMAIAGPLIRVLGDRYGGNVKVSVLETLVELVRKVGVAAKAFIPQLQTSYLKSLVDPNQPVRSQAVTGIIELVELSPRVDSVFNEIHSSIKKTEDTSLRNTLLEALCGVLKSAGKRMSDKHKLDIKDTLIQLQNTVHEGNRFKSANCLGIILMYLSDAQLVDIMKNDVINLTGIGDWGVLQSKGITLKSAIDTDTDRIIDCDLKDDMESAILQLANSDRVPVCITGLDCITSFINQFKETPPTFLVALTDCLTNVSSDVRQFACTCCGNVMNPSDEFLKTMIGPLLVCTKDKNTAVKTGSERALIDVLLLKTENNRMKYCMDLLDGPTARRLEECHSRVLSKKI
ncbi:PREDICTED: eIF-2-alpha kinase activator GCN1 isoform X2 [Amphimedon queenslandica]|uniref:TOG domain-containing protein n=1 Tax=Amphimedon queenslandica TaxID=400682 RepID=A0AAN0J8E4_AMPQE|nr:PREDICTED: eIF-2-alpha kinase activator GCN1 isoform X2 [Amphimedon queenslandica]|eukprot:XP_019853006.1 PREDICTED: eIF-2-alpha kinase activator GCN1 isoform X2 [Amphimedon queenslandica]